MTRRILQATKECLNDPHAQRLLREQLRCVLGMLSSLEVKVLRPT